MTSLLMKSSESSPPLFPQHSSLLMYIILTGSFEVCELLRFSFEKNLVEMSEMEKIRIAEK